MTTPSHPLLWQVMQKAHDATIAINHPFATNGQLRAAEILAVRDWLVPEEGDPPVGEGEPWPQAYQQRSDAMWEQRQVLRFLLTAEANRAERGEVQP